jgi:hypothetical protein
MSNGNFNPDESNNEAADSTSEGASAQGSPNPVKPPDPKDKPNNHIKPRLVVRLWRVHRKRQKKIAPPNWAEKITVFLILVTAAIAGLQLRIYTQQREIMKQQKGIMESSGHQTDQLIEAADIQAIASRRNVEASRREAHAADRNADAAESFADSASNIQLKIRDAEKDFQRMATAAEDSVKTVSETDQRAWVGVEVTEGVKLPPTPEQMVDTMKAQGYIDIPYTFILKNTGKTPARYMKIRSTWSFGPEAVQPGQSDRPDSLQVIFPGEHGQVTSGHPVRIKPGDELAWTLGARYVFIYVYIEYSDIFPGTKPHHTWTCTKFQWFGTRTACSIGNDAD